MNPSAAPAPAARRAASPRAAAAGGEPGAATSTEAGPHATAATPTATSSSSKWHAYYEADPTSAPWDTHDASSQLRAYLCGCSSGTPAAAPSAPAPSAATQGATGPGGAAPHASAAGLLHVCERCARTKPPALVEWLAATATGVGAPEAPGSVGTSGRPPPLPPRPPRVLEMCCGTGGSLAYMRRLGFHVVGAELVEAACRVAAERLAAAAAAAGPSETAHATAGPGELSGVVVEAVCSSGSGSGSGSGAVGSSSGNTRVEEAPAGPAALLLHGDLFAAAASRQIAPQSFDFVYDCQGLHAMPGDLRPAYARVMAAALRPGGTALVLVGRREGDGEVAAAAAAAGRDGQRSRGCCGGGGGLSELKRLFPSADAAGQHSGAGAGVSGAEAGEAGGSSTEEEGRWQWLGCSATRFDLTTAYRQLPAAPPAWCLLLRRC
ncbi:hypothetical protein HXX76_008179 [Chlamydomonas incerta]|uniref:Methyltransferase domain-containing protein n=1 Tax=Chlamydomonas incerta TaxID=51695 RepID=A0A835SUZ0_CHLIN|nr:hypothetical protein HXX76_008179 [Chlamydomonas incerta]|eukprot:KAG2433822.1 hypothetical protein HXX76_008179 [Chlamydomonas incerta]